MTHAGMAVPAITADQMREVDQVAVEETGPNLFQMMENAGRSLASMAMKMLGEDWRSLPIVVLAGTGGNGGGGICAARHLANRGADVTIVVSDQRRLGPVPEAQLRVYEGTPGRRGAISNLHTLNPALIIDAVIGYSLSGAPHGHVADMIRWCNQKPVPTLSLDVPSGLDATTGEALGQHVTASHTMTLALPKTGLTGDAVGELWLADIGITNKAYHRVGIGVPTTLFGPDFVIQLRHPIRV